MAKFLVTGGAGFIGSHIVQRLLKDGHYVRVLDNFSTGKDGNLSFTRDIRANKYSIIRGDIRVEKDVQKAISGVDYVLHQAALRSVPKSMTDPLGYNEVNVTGTLRLLVEAVRAKVKRFVLASSSSIYGERLSLPQKEKDLPLPISPYAASKLMGEYYCYIFAKSYGLSTVSLRYFNVFGPRQSLESEYAVVIPKFITSILKGESPPIYGDGRQSRDFTYIDNVVEANLKAISAKDVSGQVFNIASSKNYTVNDLLESLNRITKTHIKPRYISPRPGDVRHTLADISKAKKLLKFKVTVDFREGLKRTVEWFRLDTDTHRCFY